jgi:hypothetical protein
MRKPTGPTDFLIYVHVVEVARAVLTLLAHDATQANLDIRHTY